jgi:hypothetical protein
MVQAVTNAREMDLVANQLRGQPVVNCAQRIEGAFAQRVIGLIGNQDQAIAGVLQAE